MKLSELIQSCNEEEIEIIDQLSQRGWVLRHTQNMTAFEFLHADGSTSNALLDKEDIIAEGKLILARIKETEVVTEPQEIAAAMEDTIPDGQIVSSPFNPLTPTILIEKIRTDGGTQARVQMNMLTVSEYADAMKAGAIFPPVVLFYDGESYWLADGFYRHSAAKQAGKAEIPCTVKEGTLRDAILYAVGANATHGVQRTNEDKRRAVLMMLEDSEWSTHSDSWIAEKAFVSQPFVSNLRRELASQNGSENEPKLRKSKTGKVIDTSNIGKREKKEVAEPTLPIEVNGSRFIINEHGVITNPDCYEIYKIKAYKALIYYAYINSNWYVAESIWLPNSGSSSPCSVNRESFQTRGAAISEGLTRIENHLTHYKTGATQEGLAISEKIKKAIEVARIAIGVDAPLPETPAAVEDDESVENVVETQPEPKREAAATAVAEETEPVAELLPDPAAWIEKAVSLNIKLFPHAGEAEDRMVSLSLQFSSDAPIYRSCKARDLNQFPPPLQKLIDDVKDGLREKEKPAKPKATKNPQAKKAKAVKSIAQGEN